MVQDFATVDDVEAWARAQPLGMGRLKVGLMVEQRRLTARGLAVAGQWLGPGGRAGPAEPVLLPEAALPEAAVAALPDADAPAAQPARARRFRWLEATAILLLLGLAGYLAVCLAKVAGRM
ncbi:MAG: hypothetical protein V4505_19390 [Pseudomonadota bacterium]